MAKTIAPLLPSTTDFLQRFGERLRLARLRRRLTAKQVAERAGMAPMTLRSLERGGAGVTMGAYLTVMQVLGIEKDLDLLGAADPLGRELQDARLTARGKPSASVEPVKRRQTVTVADMTTRRVVQTTPGKSQPRPRKGAGRWIEKSGFTSAQSLVDLIDPKSTAPSRRR
ncbi:MAG: helix-turn-helix domain-containing protein [Gammaproteobacteria bacterium]|nr:helix-turn-helix domain-containing protein [Gammaproteobacteria bacterium]